MAAGWTCAHSWRLIGNFAGGTVTVQQAVGGRALQDIVTVAASANGNYDQMPLTVDDRLCLSTQNRLRPTVNGVQVFSETLTIPAELCLT